MLSIFIAAPVAALTIAGLGWLAYRFWRKMDRGDLSRQDRYATGFGCSVSLMGLTWAVLVGVVAWVLSAT
ncbi:MAG: hypothetical protein OXF79_20920 [Chloroflexi bacterium]|nr:hypothetical protein [Chloroflexota bacterium]